MVQNFLALLLVCALHSGVWANRQGQTNNKPQIIPYEAIPLSEDVHRTIDEESTASDGHRGCFRDNRIRDLPHKAYENAANSIEQCRNACQKLDFRFAGVQMSSCFCGNSFGRYGKAGNCKTKCPGDSNEICGGGSASNVYVVRGYSEPVPEGPFEHYGCYKDTLPRDVPNLVYNNPTNTIEKCRDACQKGGFQYAAVQNITFCSCGNSFGRYGTADNCNLNCAGNNKQICGGRFANNIFGVSGYVEPIPEGKLQYFGCFRDDTAFPDLPHLANVKSNNIESCKSACQTLGFRFAAVQQGSKCFCGNSFGRYGKSKKCDMKCSGNSQQTCGGSLENGVFSAAYVKPKESKRRYLGCYRDRRVRDLPHLAYTGTNSIELCASACRKMKLKFAALQFSFLCFCGDTYGKYGAATSCNTRCLRNRDQFCGGAWANSVYDATALP